MTIKAKSLKRILAPVFATWALIIFVVTMIPVVLLMWLIGLFKEPGRTRIFRVISKIWMRLFFLCTGCRLKVRGKEHFKQGENYIVVCNHNSYMDVPLTTPFIPGPNKTIAKAGMAKIPLFGLIYKRGSILVDRKDKNSRANSYKKMKEVLLLGIHMCIYPEGTRNKTTEPLKEFHDGAFRLAVETGKSILPTLLFNTKEVLPSGKGFYFWPSKMELHFLDPVTVAGTDDFSALKESIHALMRAHYVAHCKTGKGARQS